MVSISSWADQACVRLLDELDVAFLVLAVVVNVHSLALDAARHAPRPTRSVLAHDAENLGLEGSLGLDGTGGEDGLEVPKLLLGLGLVGEGDLARVRAAARAEGFEQAPLVGVGGIGNEGDGCQHGTVFH